MVNKVAGGYTPDYAMPPGEMLAHEMEIRGMTQQELTRRTGVTTKHINELINAKAPISPAMAIKLERAIGMPAQYWMNLEANYQEVLARLAEEKQLLEDLDWIKRVPYAAMAKLGWVPETRDKTSRLEALLSFFGIASVSRWDDMWPNLKVAYRQSQKQEIIPEAVSAWLRQGEIEAAKIACVPYDRTTFRLALDQARTLTIKSPDEFIPKLIQICSEAGVAVVFVPSLPKTGVSGATRWLNKDKAVIQLSLRYRSDDHLWFTFFHEAGHILLHGKKELFLEGNNGLHSDKENEADVFARKELIPAKEYKQLISEKDFSHERIVTFAQSISIAPGIVAGRLQHDEKLHPSQCNDLKQFYKWDHE